MKLEDIRKYWNQSGRLELDEIVHLFAHVDDLIADRDSWMQQANDRVKDWDDMRQERDALSAVVERQREALERISTTTIQSLEGETFLAQSAEKTFRIGEMKGIALAVLEETPATALRLHDAEVLERLAPAYERCDNEMDKYVAKCLRYNAFRLRAGGEG